MAKGLTPSPKMQFFNGVGDPLVGGKLYTYASGTTTPLATYTDATGGTANTNPIILDARGEASIWLSGVSYKFVLHDADDTPIWTGDAINGFHEPTIAEVYDQFNDSDGSNLVGFIQAGTDAVTRTMQDKARESVSVKDFGAVGDGVTDNTAAIQAALNTGKNVYIPDGSFFFSLPLSYTADNQSIYGSGNNSILKHRGLGSSGPSWISTNGFDNVSFCNLQVDGGSGGTGANPGLWIDGGSQNVTVDGVFFNGGGQVVFLDTCSDIKVVNNTFYGCRYGIIQRFGYASSYVLIDGNTCINSQKDFVEANCASSAPSEQWVISNNTYNTAADFPTPVTESRFVGITSVRGVIITGNAITKAAGDSAIHLEDTFGDTIISNNIIDNCLVSGGNNAYLFLLNTAEDTVISNNIFLRTDTTLPSVYALSVNSNLYANALVVNGNLVRGDALGGNLSGFDFSFQSNLSSTNCIGNVFEDLGTAVMVNNTNNANISTNSFIRCATGITSSVGAVTDSVFNGNNFVGTTGANDIIFTTTTRVSVQNSSFSKAVNMGTCTDVFVNNNRFSTTASLVTPSGTRAYAPSNVFDSVSISQSRYQNLGGTYQLEASKRGINVGGSAVVTFQVACAASASWTPGFIQIQVGAADGGLTAFSAAWWAYRFAVLGNDTNTVETVVDSGGTTASYSIVFTNVSTSATQVVFDVAITATNADRVVARLTTMGFNGVISIV